MSWEEEKSSANAQIKKPEFWWQETSRNIQCWSATVVIYAKNILREQHLHGKIYISSFNHS